MKNLYVDCNSRTVQVSRIGIGLDVSAAGVVTEIPIPQFIRVKVVKNKVSPPFKEVEFDIIYNEGISQIGEIIDLGINYGIIDKAGAWFAFKGERIGQGRENAKKFLKENEDMKNEIRSLILDSVGIANAALPSGNDSSLKVVEGGLAAE